MADQEDEIDRRKFEKKNLKDYLNPKQLQHIKDSFKSNDADNSNEVDIGVIKETLEKIGLDLNDESFQKIFEDIERKGKATIDFDQFIDMITQKLSEVDSMEQMEKVFSLFIGDENVDKIDQTHLEKICPYFDRGLIDEMVEKADKAKDGKVSFEEFYNIITKKI